MSTKGMTRISVLVVVLSLIVVGCAGFTQWFSDNQLQLELAIDIAVAATIDTNPDSADSIMRGAQNIIKVVDASQVTSLEDLNRYIFKQLDTSTLSIADKNVLLILFRNLESSLMTYYQNTGIQDASKQLVVVKQVAEMVVRALTEPQMQTRVKMAQKKSLQRKGMVMP